MDICALDYVELSLYCLLLLNTIISRRNRTRFRRWWTQPHLTENQRQLHGAYSNLFRYFKLNNHEQFYNFVGLTVPQFDHLLGLVRARLTKRSRRPSLAPELRLAAVLKYVSFIKLRYVNPYGSL